MINKEISINERTANTKHRKTLKGKFREAEEPEKGEWVVKPVDYQECKHSMCLQSTENHVFRTME